MIKEKELKKELTVEDLMKITWDYSKEEVIGLYEGKIVAGFLFEVKECGDVNPSVIRKCNVVEGWVENFKFDEKGNPKMQPRLNCNVVVDILDSQGKVIVSLGKKD